MTDTCSPNSHTRSVPCHPQAVRMIFFGALHLTPRASHHHAIPPTGLTVVSQYADTLPGGLQQLYDLNIGTLETGQHRQD